jgi:hypothetical protein
MKPSVFVATNYRRVALFEKGYSRNSHSIMIETGMKSPSEEQYSFTPSASGDEATLSPTEKE